MRPCDIMAHFGPELVAFTLSSNLFLSLLIVLLFAPISWTHYILLLLPFFPTCLKLNTGRKLLSLYCIGWSLVWFPIGNMIKYLCKLPILGYGRTLGYICLLIWGLFTLWNLSEDILQKELSNLDSRHAWQRGLCNGYIHGLVNLDLKFEPFAEVGFRPEISSNSMILARPTGFEACRLRKAPCSACVSWCVRG